VLDNALIGGTLEGQGLLGIAAPLERASFGQAV